MTGLDRPIQAELEAVYTVGRIDGDPWEEFQSLDRAAFSSDGTLYLVDRGSAQVIAVRDGELAHHVGQEGDGPGEYRDPVSVTALSSGAVAVWDPGKRAFLLFGPDGRSLDQLAPDFAAGIPMSDVTAASGDALLGLPSHLVSGRRGAIYQTAGGFRSARDGLPLLRIPVAEGEAVRELTSVSTLQPGTVDPSTLAFLPRPSWGPLERGMVALNDSDEYEIRILSAEGRVLRTLRRDLEPRPTTRSDERAFLRFVRERYERSLRRSTVLRPQEPSGEVNAHPVIPPIQRLVTDGQSRIWVQRPGADNPMRAGRVDVLDTGGEYLGTFADPAPGLPAAFGPNGLVVFLGTGEFDIPVASIFRLPATLR